MESSIWEYDSYPNFPRQMVDYVGHLCLLIHSCRYACLCFACYFGIVRCVYVVVCAIHLAESVDVKFDSFSSIHPPPPRHMATCQPPSRLLEIAPLFSGGGGASL